MDEESLKVPNKSLESLIGFPNQIKPRKLHIKKAIASMRQQSSLQLMEKVIRLLADFNETNMHRLGDLIKNLT